MSLINQMLRDLHARRENPHHTPLLSTLSVVSGQSGERFSILSMILAGFVILLALMAGYFYLQTKKLQAIPQPVIHQAQVKQQVPQVISSQQLNVTHQVQDKLQSKLNMAQDTAPHKRVQSVYNMTLPYKKDILSATKQTQHRQIHHPHHKKIANTSTFVVQAVKAPEAKQVKLHNAYQKILLAIAEGHLNRASQQLRAMLSLHPRYLAVRTTLANILIEKHHLQQAATLLKKGLAYQPGNPGLLQRFAHVYMEKGKVKQAIHVLLTASPDMGSHQNYYALLAALFQRDHQYQRSASMYRQLLQQDPDNAIWWMGLGIALEGASQSQQALQAYEKAQQVGYLAPNLQSYVDKRVATLNR